VSTGRLRPPVSIDWAIAERAKKSLGDGGVGGGKEGGPGFWGGVSKRGVKFVRLDLFRVCASFCHVVST